MNFNDTRVFRGYRTEAMLSALSILNEPLTDNAVLSDAWTFNPVRVDDADSQVEAIEGLDVRAPNVRVYHGVGCVELYPVAVALHYVYNGKRVWLVVPQGLFDSYGTHVKGAEEMFVVHGSDFSVPKSNKVIVIPSGSVGEYVKVMGAGDAMVFINPNDISLVDFHNVLPLVKASEVYPHVNVVYTDGYSDEEVEAFIKYMRHCVEVYSWKNLISDINANINIGNDGYDFVLMCGENCVDRLGTSDPGVYCRAAPKLAKLSHKGMELPLSTSCYTFSIGNFAAKKRFTVFIYRYMGDYVVRSMLDDNFTAGYNRRFVGAGGTLLGNVSKVYSNESMLKLHYGGKFSLVTAMLSRDGLKKRNYVDYDVTSELVGCDDPYMPGGIRRFLPEHLFDYGMVERRGFHNYFSSFNMTGKQLLKHVPMRARGSVIQNLIMHSTPGFSDSRYCWIHAFDTVIHHQLIMEYPPLLLLHEFQSVVALYGGFYHGHYVIEHRNYMYFHIRRDITKYVPPSMVVNAWSFRDLSDYYHY